MDDQDILDNNFDEKEPLDIKYAGFWVRVGASIIDILIFLPFILFEFYNKISLHSTVLMILASVLMIIYKPYLEYTRGATLGKSALGLKVVNTAFEPLSLNQALLRFIPWMISYFIALMMNIGYYSEGDYASNFVEIGLKTQGTFWASMNNLYGIVFIIIVVVVAFDSKKQGLHDKIAETYCIETK